MGACALKPVDLDGEGWQEELTDSKRLTEKKRERLAETIRERAVLLGLGKVEAEEIDRIGLAEALRTAARTALINALNSNPQNDSQNDPQPAPRTTAPPKNLAIDEIIIDGPQNFLKGTLFEDKVTTMNKADLLMKPVSAAAIVAKVYRDGLMRELANNYPEYDFDHNVGYGTKKHLEALAQFGPCAEHRFSYKPVQKACEGRGLEVFLEKRLGASEVPEQPTKRHLAGKTALSDGQKAEMIIADFLRQNGQTILTQNFRTRTFEIDIISATAERIYFTEVKYRKNTHHGSAAESVTSDKQKRMQIGAEVFMDRLARALGRPIESLPAPQLAVGTVDGPGFAQKAWFPLD